MAYNRAGFRDDLPHGGFGAIGRHVIDDAGPSGHRRNATTGFIVSMDIGTFSRFIKPEITGRTRCSSSASLTGSALGRVDSPPISIMSAPCRTISSACAIAVSQSRTAHRPEKESGVTLTTPITMRDVETRIYICLHKNHSGLAQNAVAFLLPSFYK